MALVQTKDSRVVRDTETRALLSVNSDELLRHRRARANMKKLTAQQHTTDERFQLLNNRIDRCEALLHELSRHISELVAKYPATLPTQD